MVIHTYYWTNPSCWACTAADAARTANAYLMVCIIIANALKMKKEGGNIIIRTLSRLYILYTGVYNQRGRGLSVRTEHAV